MNTQTKRIVPPAGSVSRPWPWHVWAIVVVLFVVMLGIHFALPPPLAVTSPTLLFLGDHCTVAFRATNHTTRPTSATLLVIIGVGQTGGRNSPPVYYEFARKAVSLNLAPKANRDFSCEFPVAGRPLPNTARIEIASLATPANAEKKLNPYSFAR